MKDFVAPPANIPNSPGIFLTSFLTSFFKTSSFITDSLSVFSSDFISKLSLFQNSSYFLLEIVFAILLNIIFINLYIKK